MSLSAYLYDLATDKRTGFIPGALKVFLFLASRIYGVLVSLTMYVRRRRPARAACKVISVGNITLGGTGKTVLVEAIARFLKGKGHRVAVLTRGYKRQKHEKGSGIADYRSMGDEAFMLSKQLVDTPVLVDADRIRSAARAVRDFQADTAVLDDGFQQWKLHKDLEIVTLNAADPFGNGHLIPRGVLRQPISTLAKADIFVLTGAVSREQRENTSALLASINPKALIVPARHVLRRIYRLGVPDQALPADFLKDKPVCLFCGIGNPGSFRSLAAAAGARIQEALFFPDHHTYTEEDIEGVFTRSRACGCETIVTTEKDAVRVPIAARKRFGNDIHVIAVELKIDDEDKRFFDRLLSVHSA